MIRYHIRSVSLLNLVNDVNKGNLIPDAYFQRNLVWRDVHKKDFIKTILLGLPFPQIFISKGKIDIDKMEAVACIVDGQQRTNAIVDYINNNYDVEGKFFRDLSDKEKSEFLKYEIAVIELDLVNDDPTVQEIFKRINRTSNSLTMIEKLASEYAASEFMTTAKLLANDLVFPNEDDPEDFKVDPNVPKEFYDWANHKSVGYFSSLLTTKGIFTPREISKKAHLMHILNIQATYLTTIFNRNDKTKEFLDDYAEYFPEKDDVVDTLERTAKTILGLRLKQKSYWLNKANIFSLIVAMAKHYKTGGTIDASKLKDNLIAFENKIPDDYKLAATEAVNGTKHRTVRNAYIKRIIADS